MRTCGVGSQIALARCGLVQRAKLWAAIRWPSPSHTGWGHEDARRGRQKVALPGVNGINALGPVDTATGGGRGLPKRRPSRRTRRVLAGNDLKLGLEGIDVADAQG
jgi:hypothetical protein